MNLIGILATLVSAVSVTSDAKITDLGDGYWRVETKSYSVEVPRGWKVSEETPWGQRKVKPAEGSGGLGVMTAPPSQQTWDDLYRTSLYFILREKQGKATPYTVTKTPSGLEAASFEVLDAKGFADRRYVLIKHKEKGLLAISVDIPGKERDKEWKAHFERMVRSAKFTG